MNTNDPGREPEPTDAELQTLHELRECLAVWVSDAMVLGNIRAYDALCAVNAAIAAHRVAKTAFRAMDDAVESDGGARIEKEGWGALCDAMDEYESRMNGFCTSGARPIPDTPAPDEVAPKLGDNCATHLCPECGTGVLKPLFSARVVIPALQAANTALTARVAELEAELADARRMVCAVQPSDDHESLYCHDTVFRRVPMNWFEARDKMLSAGKEPTDAE